MSKPRFPSNLLDIHPGELRALRRAHRAGLAPAYRIIDARRDWVTVQCADADEAARLAAHVASARPA